MKQYKISYDLIDHSNNSDDDYSNEQLEDMLKFDLHSGFEIKNLKIEEQNIKSETD